MCLEMNKLQLSRQGRPLMQPITARIGKGEILTVMGPSGCGKSTLLSAIAGTLQGDFTQQGSIRLSGSELTGMKVEHRKIGILFQEALLFPHMTVIENLMFAQSQGSKREKRFAAIAALESVGLAQCGDQYPLQISGGQAARVSLLRTLQAKPAAILLDEPFSKLDKSTRKSFRDQVFTIIRERQIPAILVTHDEEDIADAANVLHLVPSAVQSQQLVGECAC